MRHQILITPIEDPPKMVILSRPQTRPHIGPGHAQNAPAPLLHLQERVDIARLKRRSFADAFQIAFWLYQDRFGAILGPERALQDTSKTTPTHTFTRVSSGLQFEYLFHYA